MPQLDQISAIYASQLFWLAIVFALIYFGIGKAMVPKIEATIDDRNGRIEGDLAAAEGARAQAHAVEAAYQTGLESARSRAATALGEAKARATANTEARLKASDAALHDQLVAATAQVEASKTQAVAEIETATTDAVEAIVAKLSGVAVDRSTIAARVKTELAHG
ncbi:F0F1 ATP synthase subunit B family protein [Sphingomonas sp. PAMC 26621]|uniref:F0F1 ATP synthase subunit B family protein n=1 Tax=Sphingomonas sp. PAMC 26621 TaxID=1112213 RepID=UPI000288B5EA|nr:H+-transporting two-sector ATPase subunit B/B' [Sphingomonas sp. PAMC 26621]